MCGCASSPFGINMGVSMSQWCCCGSKICKTVDIIVNRNVSLVSEAFSECFPPVSACRVCLLTFNRSMPPFSLAFSNTDSVCIYFNQTIKGVALSPPLDIWERVSIEHNISQKRTSYLSVRLRNAHGLTPINRIIVYGFRHFRHPISGVSLYVYMLVQIKCVRDLRFGRKIEN